MGPAAAEPGPGTASGDAGGRLQLPAEELVNLEYN